MTPIEKAVANYLAENPSIPPERIASLVVDGQKIWIKRVSGSKVKVFHKIQKVLARLIPYSMMRPSVSAGGRDTLQAEAGRLKQFKEKKILVPDVLMLGDDYIVLSDIGVQLKSHLDHHVKPNKRFELLNRAAAELGKLHKAGLCHGRPLLRDITWNEKRIGFIDLEENPKAIMTLTTAQARDIWLLMGGAARYADKDGRELKKFFEVYINQAPDDVYDALKIFVKTMKPLRQFTALLPIRYGKDVLNAMKANKVLEDIL